MANKYYRQNFRMGTNPFARKSNIQKIAEVFGPKKTKVTKDKKPKKRMMAKDGSKPDFLDFDKDGNTSESMKKALKDKKND